MKKFYKDYNISVFLCGLCKIFANFAVKALLLETQKHIITILKKNIT